MQKLGLEPEALANAAARARSVGRPDAARALADLVERTGRRGGVGAAAGARQPPPADPERGRGMKGAGVDIGIIHFVGIGGIGMSGIAEVMKILGYQVQGSDVAEGYVVEGLREHDIPIFIGHKRRQSRRRGGGRRLLGDQQGQSRGRRRL